MFRPSTQSSLFATVSLAGMLALGGCQQRPAPHATTADVDAARQQAAAEVAQAKIEASKGVKSAVKIAGAGTRDVSAAKAVGNFDVAMVQADGDYKIATAQCLTLPVDAQPGCKEKADAEYESAKAAAKATRVSRR